VVFVQNNPPVDKRYFKFLVTSTVTDTRYNARLLNDDFVNDQCHGLYYFTLRVTAVASVLTICQIAQPIVTSQLSKVVISHVWPALA
jgi:hypothetical protein